MVGKDFIQHSPETKAFWDAAARGVFLLPWCRDCHRTHWYPRGICPHCFSTALEWRRASGDGEIYSFSVNRMGEPYVLAYIALSEGLVILSRVIDTDPATVAIGTKVKVAFRPISEELPVPLFVVR